MFNTWKQWEGHAVNGKFPLLRYLGGSEYSAVFLTERRLDERLVRASIKLVHVSPQNAERQLARWQQAKELPHPHLISLYESGRCELDGVSLLYVVMEHAEENLAQVLSDRALTPEESRAMLESVLDVVAFLHGKNFVHGHIKPENILATADQLKISSEGLCRAGESPLRPGHHDAYEPPENAAGIIPAPATMSPACDVWSLGITLVEVLTQKPPVAGTEEQQDPLLPEGLPEPFLEIARHCLLRHPASRWTVAQIAARLDGRASVPNIQPAQPQGRRPADARQRPIAQPTRAPAKRRASIVPIAIGFALVLAAVLSAPKLLRRRSEPAQVPAAAARPPVDSPAPSQAVPPPQQKRPSKAIEPSAAEAERTSKMPVPVPTSIHKDAINEEEGTSEKGPGSTPVRGDVAQRVDPEVLESARDSIRGTVRVTVRVNVDRSGNVEDADLETPGPSKYFARAAVGAAKLWKFTPPRVGSQGVLSTWSLRFEFTRDGTQVVPTQENP